MKGVDHGMAVIIESIVFWRSCGEVEVSCESWIGCKAKSTLLFTAKSFTMPAGCSVELNSISENRWP